MQYEKHYNGLIENRIKNPATGYTENHHILPKSMGGSDEPSNLVRLTGREHWVAHLLLHKIHKLPQTAHACHMMAMRCEERGISQIKNSRMYQSIRIECSKQVSQRMKKYRGNKNSQYGTMWICNVELKENCKIDKEEKIPEGWIKGRNKWKNKNLKQKCKKCGNYICKRKSICQNTMRINRFIKSFGFDKSKMGSEEFYSEYDRIVLKLKEDYEVNKLSVEEIKNKYKIKSNESMRYILKSIGVHVRNLKDSLNNYFSRGSLIGKI